MTARRRSASGGFDRIPGRRERPAESEGRAALFSVPPAEAGEERPRPRVPGLTVSCSACGTVSPTNPVALMLAAFPVTMVLPWRPQHFWGTCPTCRHRAWLGLGWRW